MYSYEYDHNTGGIILKAAISTFSKEPRPVYYREMDLLGFDKYWKYEKEDDAPYMWAEGNNYWYRGELVAKTKGGSCYDKPELLIQESSVALNDTLYPVDIDAMLDKNKEIMDSLTLVTMKTVYNTFENYKDKIDVFYVAFSGGKDSLVTLDIVRRSLPHENFKVLFGDTQMEFPDTYRLVDDIEKQCKRDNIDFIRTKSDKTPSQTWNEFGPPASVSRWCCSVHKTVPQILALREYLNKINFTGMAFIGIRSSESSSRSEYDYLSVGKKHKGQYSCNPILDWGSAELYIYMYLNNIPIGEAYKKGNRRVGCLVCPKAAERNDFVSRYWYRDEFDALMDIVRNNYIGAREDEQRLDEFIANGGWKARKNGRDISTTIDYSEVTKDKKLILKVEKPKTSWKEWIKTIGILMNDISPYQILFRGEVFSFELSENDDTSYSVIIDENLVKKQVTFVMLLKQVFRRAACCVTCLTCAVDCHSGCISMDNGQVYVNDNCIHCAQCHKVEKGCWVYKSLENPRGGTGVLKSKSLNSYSHHAPKFDWIKQYFKYKEDFHESHELGSVMYNFFRRFLSDSGLSLNGEYSEFAKIIDTIGIDEELSWALMLINLSYTPQINWFVRNIPFESNQSKEYILSKLLDDGAKESWVKDVWASFMRFTELPFSRVGMGYGLKTKRKYTHITREAWEEPRPFAILYSLYKFAEYCDNYYIFNLSDLYNQNIISEGVSPRFIFGISEENLKAILLGLSIKYPDFINVKFTHDLETIKLNSEKSSKDVLSMIAEEE